MADQIPDAAIDAAASVLLGAVNAPEQEIYEAARAALIAAQPHLSGWQPVETTHIEREMRWIDSISLGAIEDIAALEAAWPVSKRGSRANAAFASLIGRINGIRQCVVDAGRTSPPAQNRGQANG